MGRVLNVTMHESDATAKGYRLQRGVGRLKLNGDGVIQDINPAMLSILGRSRRECIGQRIDQFMSGWEGVLRQPHQAPRHAKRVRTEVRCPDGTVKTMMASVSALFSDKSLSQLECALSEPEERADLESGKEPTRNYNRSPLEGPLCEAQAFCAYAEQLREEERQRLGQKIHDCLGGILTYLKFDLTRLEKDIEGKNAIFSVPELKKKIESLVHAASDAIATVQKVGMELKPLLLEQAGFTATIEWHLKDFERRTGIRSRIHNKSRTERINYNISLLLFRIVQEALTNISRHAHATEVTITLMDQAEEFVLTIEDNGIGIPVEALTRINSLGITGMRERAHLAGGELSFSPSRTGGTVLTITIPVGTRRKISNQWS